MIDSNQIDKLQKNEFQEYSEDIFCDELEGYTFCPYVIQKGQKNSLSDIRSQLRGNVKEWSLPDKIKNIWNKITDGS